MINSPQEFRALRTSEIREEYIRAAHEEAPLEVWREIIAVMPDMREWVARNKTVPLEILRLLAQDPDESVRESVAERRRLSDELFQLLAKDPSECVRARIAWNRKTPQTVLEILTQDSVQHVREGAWQQLSQRSKRPNRRLE